MTALYDTHNNMQGTLLLARDVTRHERMLKTHRTFRWLTAVGGAILFIMLAALLLGYPYFATAYREKNSNVAQIEKNIATDLIYFKTLLGKHVATGDVAHLQTFSEFLNRQPNKSPLYTGIVLLNQFKHVVHVSRADFAIDEPDIPLGSSYTDIDFQSVKESDHFLLSLYRTSTAYPMGRKGIEVAFGLSGREQGIKWLVLQLNTDLLVTVFKIKDADLLDMRLVYP